MAYLNICGFESGALDEANATSGTVSVQSSNKRTGGYALEFSHGDGDAGTFTLAGIGATAKTAALAQSTAYLTFYLYIVGASTTNDTDSAIVRMGANADGSSHTVILELDIAGKLKLGGSSSVTMGSALTENAWHRVDVKAVNGGTCELVVDGTSIGTCTGAAQTINYVVFGRAATATSTLFRVDDVAISDSAYPGAGQVNVMTVDGNGSVPAGFSDSPDNGSGNEYQSLDEIPHDSGSSYVATQAGSANQVAYFTCISAATAGVSGTIGTVKTIGILAEASSATTLGYIRTRSGTTNSDSTAVDVGTTAYVTFAKLNDVDPADSAAWTSSDLDGLNIGFGNGADTSVVRCTLLCAMVWCSGSVTVTGTGDPVLPSLTAALTGAQVQTGTGAPALPNVTAAGTGAQTQTGTAAPILPSLAAALSGVMVPSGTGAVSLPSLTASATGTAGFDATGAATLPALIASGTGTHPYTGTAAISLPSLVASLSGEQTQTGSAAVALPSLTASLTGVMLPSGEGAATLPALTADADGTQEQTATGSPALPALSADGVGGIPTIGEAAITLPFLVAAMTGLAPLGIVLRRGGGTTATLTRGGGSASLHPRGGGSGSTLGRGGGSGAPLPRGGGSSTSLPRGGGRYGGD